MYVLWNETNGSFWIDSCDRFGVCRSRRFAQAVNQLIHCWQRCTLQTILHLCNTFCVNWAGGYHGCAHTPVSEYAKFSDHLFLPLPLSSPLSLLPLFSMSMWSLESSSWRWPWLPSPEALPDCPRGNDFLFHAADSGPVCALLSAVTTVGWMPVCKIVMCALTVIYLA